MSLERRIEGEIDERSRSHARIFNRIELSRCNACEQRAYVRPYMVVSFRTRHFLVYTTCLRYQRIEERASKVGIDGRHTRYAYHIVPGIDYNYGESIGDWYVRNYRGQRITIVGARVRSPVMKVSATAALCARLPHESVPRMPLVDASKRERNDSNALLVKRDALHLPEMKKILAARTIPDRVSTICKRSVKRHTVRGAFIIND